ncbi:MAG: 1-deoxy-D-xylulose-5-phosphate synthase [Clostridiales bacterium]|nr:1-deoxy-D-xylulose-5-phosphate synthase [Clostridiales bacterium]
MQTKLLPSIHSPDDVKKLPFDSLQDLCGEIREELIHVISKNGGHLASNLGVVELTVALHRVFQSPQDQIVWDVGHQCYPHKLLTGRCDRFDTLRQENGLSGFCRPQESEHDPFISGHSSTSISAALGLARAKTLRGDLSYTIAVIGDGALTGGLAYEALNNAGRSRDRLIVILNDNRMSISRNVGAVARHLAVIRSKPGYFKLKSSVWNMLERMPRAGKGIEKYIIRMKASLKNMLYNNTIFENMGFAYVGPVDGHNLHTLCDVLSSCRTVHRPVLLHVCTTKGKGYPYAEDDPSAFHGTPGFNVETGDAAPAGECFSSRFGDALCRFAQKDSRICAVTAAMAPGTGLSPFARQFKNRFFDVGIAEQHAVTFCSGLAKNGMMPVFAVYSTFLQRSYDQLVHDAALQNVHMVLGIDRAGIVGEDGETHQGILDVSFLSSIPDVTILSPSYYEELDRMLEDALYRYDGVVALRYPRGREPYRPDDFAGSSEAFDCYGDASSRTVIVTYGRLFGEACRARKMLAERGIKAAVLKLNRIHPLDESCLNQLARDGHVFFFEEAVKRGSVGEHFGLKLFETGYKGRFYHQAVNDCFVPQATVQSTLSHLGLTAEKMAGLILRECGKA